MWGRKWLLEFSEGFSEIFSWIAKISFCEHHLLKWVESCQICDWSSEVYVLDKRNDRDFSAHFSGL
jgi:hypothetical protein